MVTAKKDEAIKQKKAADALKATEDKGAEGVNAHKWVQSDRMLLLALSWHFFYISCMCLLFIFDGCICTSL